VIETKRLILRKFTLDDVEPSYKMNMDPIVSQFTGDGGVVSREEIHRRIEENVMGDYKKYGYGRLAVTLKSTGEFIGFAGLKYLDDMDEVDLGYRFIQEVWGQGIATEACTPLIKYGFEELGLKSIIAMVLPENKASIRVLEKLNFVFDKNIDADGDDALLFRTLNRMLISTKS
jgi:ribosomal-protein-alanine N-acetyltransferase